MRVLMMDASRTKEIHHLLIREIYELRVLSFRTSANPRSDSIRVTTFVWTIFFWNSLSSSSRTEPFNLLLQANWRFGHEYAHLHRCMEGDDAEWEDEARDKSFLFHRFVSQKLRTMGRSKLKDTCRKLCVCKCALLQRDDLEYDWERISTQKFEETVMQLMNIKQCCVSRHPRTVVKRNSFERHFSSDNFHRCRMFRRQMKRATRRMKEKTSVY